MISYRDSDWTLTELLSALGYTHKPAVHYGERHVTRGRTVAFFTGTCFAVTAWLFATGQVQ